MKGTAILAPIPACHLESALEVLKQKPFVLFGSEAWERFENTEIGSQVLIYVSHDQAEPLVKYTGTYEGLVGEQPKMRQLTKDGYRPQSTAGEKWSFFWKLANLQKLEVPIQLSDIKLASGKYLDGYPKGPLHVIG